MDLINKSKLRYTTVCSEDDPNSKQLAVLASDIKNYFETNPAAVEVLIFKGKKTISVNRYQVQSPLFNRNFRKKYEK